MVDINISLVYQICNFLILIFVLNTILYRPIRNVLLQRRERVDGMARDIESADQEAKKNEDRFLAGIKDARQKGVKERNQLVESAESEEKLIIGKINEKALADLKEVRGNIAQEVEAVRNSLLKEVDQFARDIGEKILGGAF